jgi:hypothetical protein
MLLLKGCQRGREAAATGMPRTGQEWNQHKSRKLLQIFSNARALMFMLKISMTRKILMPMVLNRRVLKIKIFTLLMLDKH